MIEVVEKGAVTPPDQALCVHLVARKSGVVEQVIPYQGEPLVKKGDVVQAGDMLVECALRYWAGGRPAVIPGMPLPPAGGPGPDRGRPGQREGPGRLPAVP